MYAGRTTVSNTAGLAMVGVRFLNYPPTNMEDEDQTVLALVWKTRGRLTAPGARLLLLPPLISKNMEMW
jgi:hypothetical protein